MSTVYERAFQKYGEDKQLLKAIEELDELRQAICDYQEYIMNIKINQVLTIEGYSEKLIDHIIEEATDVNIMNTQLSIIFPNRAERWLYWHKFKTERLQKRIEESS